MSKPPGMAEWLLRRLVGGRDADAVAGDLHETFEARGGSRLWYWGQVLSCLAVRLSLYRRAFPGIGTDFSRALRRIRHNPGYAITAMLCLALALGVNATLFSFLDGLYFRKLPVPEADRMVQIGRNDLAFCTPEDYYRFRDELRSVQAVSAVLYFDSLEIGRSGFDANIEQVSANYPQVLRVGTTLGTWFEPQMQVGAERSVVISYRLWKTRFGGDPNILGKSITLFLSRMRIAGVAPREFTGTTPPFLVDVWVPEYRPGYARFTKLIGRMTPGSSIANVTEEMRVIAARLRAADPRNEILAAPVTVRPHVGFVSDSRRSNFLPILVLLCSVAGIVLLIACVNVANLLLSRAAVRQREMAIRQSLGASRARLFRETFAEGLVLAAGGLLLGVLFGYATGRAVEIALPSVPNVLYQGLRLGIDWRVALLMASAGTLCAILFSLPPALANSRRNLSPAMKGGDIRHSRQREFYSIAQVAGSLVLLIATGLLLRALNHVQHIDPGFATDHRLFVQLRARGTVYTPQAAAALYSRLLQQARELPGVQDATLAWEVFPSSGFWCAGPSHEDGKEVRTNTVDPNYFEMMGIPIVRGRGFSLTDSTDTTHAIVNQTMARRFWPNEDAVGKTVWIGGCPGGVAKPATVIGVARDAKYNSMDEQPQPLFYVSRRDDPQNPFYALLIRTAGEPRQWTQPLVDLVRRNGGDLRIYDSGTLGDAVTRSLWEAKWQASLLAALGLLAIVLAAIGVYGVVACSVSQRTREIGVRMALGALPLDVQWMVLAHGLRLTAIGIAAGLLLSAATVRLLRGFLYGLSPFDPVAFAAASLAWIAIAMLASWYPARRATRVDPMTALNYD
jgi:macrolide transport system ATP-binding/permease protein